MSWLNLLLAGLLEIGWAIGLYYSAGFTRLLPSILTGCCLIASLVFLSLALRNLPLGTAYAIWTAIGTAGTAVFGMLVLQEPATTGRLICLVMIVGGVTGLKLLSPH